MSLTIAVPRATASDELRVAASPDTVKKLAALGCFVKVETNAGIAASITDDMFKAAGAQITGSAAEACKDADIVLCVQAPTKQELAAVKSGAIIAGMLAPYANGALVKDMAAAGVTAMSLELAPRITRAQALDVLSSQSNLAGYKAVLDGAAYFNRAFPMMMTAAGTVPPARVFVMGAGVAGLQAIATARRLGAIVSATDVRPAAKEQVQSLGGTFVAVEDEEFKQAETAGGYAKQMSPEYQAKQLALVEETIAKQDVVITTALIPGRKAPVLVTAKMVASMKPGSVIVDLAAEQGGNCEATQPGEVIDKNGVIIVGYRNVPSRIAASASSLYARNLFNLIQLIVKDGAFTIDENDEIIKAITLTRGGAIVHQQFAQAN